MSLSNYHLFEPLIKLFFQLLNPLKESFTLFLYLGFYTAKKKTLCSQKLKAEKRLPKLIASSFGLVIH